MAKYVIGIDYGTDSARSLIVNAENGDELASSVMDYPRWIKGKYCDPSINQYRQHPLDYIDVLEFTITDALSKCDSSVASQVVGISIDTTGSTPVMTNENGVPLALTAGFENNPNAMFVLWKDHTAVKEAEEINTLASSWAVDYTKYEGGVYSSEWVWAKILHILREDNDVKKAAYSWIEHCDWLPGLLSGNLKPERVPRSRCAAGHKSMWHTDWDGLPPDAFFVKLDPSLSGYRNRLYNATFTSDVSAGNLTKEWAERLGLTTNVAVGVGAFDCHMGAVGGEVTPHVLARAIGTSTCDIMIAKHEDVRDKLIAGICGQVDGSVIPGYVGLEAGQSGFGDVYAWFKRLITSPTIDLIEESSLINNETKEKLINELLDKSIPQLTKQAMSVPIEESSILALDWMNGRRTPDANQEVTGAITGITLGSTAPKVFRALIEATAFGSKAIVDRFRREGVEINEIIGLGGVAKKSPFVMQTLADVLNMPIKIATTEQTCAFGAAMFAAVVGGVYEKVEDAQKAMGKGFEKVYTPQPENVESYRNLYNRYISLGKFVTKSLS